MAQKQCPRLLLAAIMFFLPGVLPARAGAFPWRDDPFSGAGPGPGFTFSNSGPNGNTHTLINNIAGSGAAVSRLLVMPAWFWPLNNPITMA